MSSIKFKNIILHHFMSYDHEEFDLDRNGYIFISGVNNNEVDNAKSNGSGKSSLFSAICWCLTGETPNGNKKVENIYLSGQTYVEIQFNINSIDYILKRTKNPSNLTIIVNGEDKSGKGIRDGEKLLEEYLPDITSSLINSVIILGQGLPKRFTNNTPAGRKEVLEKLSNSDFMVADIKDRINSRFSKLNHDKLDREEKLIINKTEINVLQELILKNTEKLNNINISELEISLEKLKSDKILLQNDIDSFEAARNEVNVQIDNLTSELSALSEEYNHNLSILPGVPQSYFSEHGALTSELNSKEKEIRRLDSVVDICPTCGQKIPGAIKLDTTELKAECELLKISINEISEKIKLCEEENKLQKTILTSEYNGRKNEIDNKLSVFKSDYTNYSNIISNKEFELKKVSEKIIEIEVELNSINSIKLDLEHSISENTNKITILSDEIEAHKLVIDNLQQRIDIISKITTLIKRDFRGYLLSNIISFISEKVKLYSSEVFGSDNFNFELDGNNINISYDNKEYESLSGGEKQKADVIIQLAIRDMLCNYLNFSSNILVLDEITDSLDIIGSQNILNLISKELTDVEAIYIISHHSDFNIPWDEEITIAKGSDRISRIIS